MIEFKQIIGRGTRLFDGKDYFTIYDFVKAYEHFSDPEWDGEPADPVVPTPRPGGSETGEPTVRRRRSKGADGRPMIPDRRRPQKHQGSDWQTARSAPSST